MGLSARRCIANVMPSRKNFSAFFLAAVAIRSSYQLFSLGHGKCGEEDQERQRQRSA